MSFKRGDIVWVKFPFSDINTLKLRPALVISNELVNKTGDHLLMQITSVLRRDHLSLVINEADYSEVQLLKQSELRLHKIFILHETLIEEKITSVSSHFMNIVIETLLRLIQSLPHKS